MTSILTISQYSSSVMPTLYAKGLGLILGEDIAFFLFLLRKIHVYKERYLFIKMRLLWNMF